MLHSTSAYFPDKPNEEERQAARQFINSFMEHGIEYPKWGEDFLAESKGEVDVTSRENFSIWVCHRHNAFNERLGKP